MNLSLGKLTTEQRLPWLGAVLSLPLVAWIMMNSFGNINSDGILYIEVARKFDAGEWRQGFGLYNWPFYPLLITLVHKLSYLGFEMSAHCLDTLFFALLTAGLLTLVREVGGDRRTMVAAGLLLFVSSTIVRSYLPMVMRDPGFWAFHIWSIVFFLRFYIRHHLMDALAWGIVATIATLFRVEGLTYLVVLPILIFLQRQLPNRTVLFAKANTLLILAGLGLLFAVLLHPTLDIHNMGRLGDPLMLVNNAHQQLAHGLVDKAHIYGATVLGKFISSYGMDGLLLTLIYILIVKAATASGWMQMVLGIYAWKFLKPDQLPAFQKVFAWLIAVGLTHAALMLLSTFVLPSRYLMPLGFIMIVYAAFGLAELHKSWQQKPWRPFRENWKFPLAAIVLTIQLSIMLWLWNPQKSYELHAANWVAAHATVGSRIYADSAHLRYYSNADQPFRRDFVTVEEIQQLFKAGQMSQYDYILVHASGERQVLASFLAEQSGSSPVAVFDNGRDTITIYRLTH